MKKMTTFIFIIALLYIPYSFANSPSYDCNKAKGDVENMICDNLFLSDLDNQLSKAFVNAINNISAYEAKKVKEDEIDWIKKRNDCSQNYDENNDVMNCIKSFYRKRYNELIKIAPLEETYSHKLYAEGNTKYNEGDYYSALEKFHEAYDNANDYVEKVRTLGALAQVSKEKGNISLAKGYAEKILSIDPTSGFAKDISNLESYEQADRVAPSNYEREQYGASDSKSSYQYDSSSKDAKQLKCLALTWGPDVCGQAFNEYAKKNMNSEVNDLITSPICSASIAKTLGAGFSESDLQLALVTGGLDALGKAGVDSDNFFGKMFGGMAYLYSFAVKASIYESCMSN